MIRLGNLVLYNVFCIILLFFVSGCSLINEEDNTMNTFIPEFMQDLLPTPTNRPNPFSKPSDSYLYDPNAPSFFEQFGNESLSIACFPKIPDELRTWEWFLQKKFPNISLDIIAYENETEYMEAMIENTIYGIGPDLFYVSYLPSFIPYGKQINTGLVDLYDMMRNDLAFNVDDYFVNAYQTIESNGKLYSIPLLFGYNTVAINKDISEELVETFREYNFINHYDMLNLYQEATFDQPYFMYDGCNVYDSNNK